MKEPDRLKIYSWHCVNCGEIVSGLKGVHGDIKAECRCCKTVMRRTIHSKKGDVIKVYAPVGMVHL